MQKILGIIFLLTFIILFNSKVFSDIEVKKLKDKNIEIIKFQAPDHNFPNNDDVLAQIHFPKNNNKKLSVIIHQHGSTRDGLKFKKWGGKTDEWGKRLIDKATERGYVVALLDTFYKRELNPTDKEKFPNAVLAAFELSYILSQDERFDKLKIFYTGFSYGAGQVMKLQDERSAYNNIFKAAVAAEPSCNIVSNPYKTKTITLIIKGEESHYYPVACKYYFNMIKNMGNEIEYVSIPKVNHFFSLNGSITTGKAVNGCSDNIVIRLPKRKFKFADGTPTSREEVLKKCYTMEAGKGRSREKLDEAIDIALNFIDKYN
ncbi:UBX domain protein [Pelagibacterales bacterium SAG-MED06]|nr:UBX domain protein [Pelagibacterales bacterium SAG-MED06]